MIKEKQALPQINDIEHHIREYLKILIREYDYKEILSLISKQEEPLKSKSMDFILSHIEDSIEKEHGFTGFDTKTRLKNIVKRILANDSEFKPQKVDVVLDSDFSPLVRKYFGFPEVRKIFTNNAGNIVFSSEEIETVILKTIADLRSRIILEILNDEIKNGFLARLIKWIVPLKQDTKYYLFLRFIQIFVYRIPFIGRLFFTTRIIKRRWKLLSRNIWNLDKNSEMYDDFIKTLTVITEYHQNLNNSNILTHLGKSEEYVSKLIKETKRQFFYKKKRLFTTSTVIRAQGFKKIALTLVRVLGDIDEQKHGNRNKSEKLYNEILAEFCANLDMLGDENLAYSKKTRSLKRIKNLKLFLESAVINSFRQRWSFLPEIFRAVSEGLMIAIFYFSFMRIFPLTVPLLYFWGGARISDLIFKRKYILNGKDVLHALEKLDRSFDLNAAMEMTVEVRAKYRKNLIIGDEKEFFKIRNMLLSVQMKIYEILFSMNGSVFESGRGKGRPFAIKLEADLSILEQIEENIIKIETTFDPSSFSVWIKRIIGGMCGLLFFDLSLFLVREFFPGHYNDNINLLETDSDQKTASANFDLKLSIEPKLTKFSENDSILYINQGESDSSMVEEPLYNHAAQFAMDAQDTYEVRKGDTLWSISKNLNIPFKISLWAKYNPQLKNPNLIYPGDIIHVPCHENSHEDLLNNSYSHAADDTAADNYIEENIFAPLDELPEYLKQKILENEIILLAGHNYKHPGASCISHGGKRIYEHSLSVKTVMFMENLLKEKFGFKNITVVPFEKNLQQKAEFINSLITERNSSKVHILEVHYNASEDSRYNGTTMIYKNGSLQSKNLAEILNNEVASNCPLKKLPGMSEKITSHSRLYLMHATNIPVDNIVISETGYMSNDEDRSTIVNNIETIASSLCSGLAKNIYRNSVIHEETFAANETLQNTSHIAF